jgi:hypothetical protein
MDAELYKEAIEYELLTQAIYQAIHQKEGINTVKVQHKVSLTGSYLAETSRRARAATGHVAAALHVMNSRRLIRSPRRRAPVTSP